MIQRKILILFILFIPSIVNAQGYIITDKDGYTNMREKPTAQSRIIDKILQYEVFLLAEDVCSNSDIDFSDTPPNWIAVTKTYNGEIGYVLKKNIQSLDELPTIWAERLDNPSRLTASNDTVSVSLLLSPLEESEHDIVYHDKEKKYIATIDGRSFKCMFAGDGANKLTEKHMEITGLEVMYGDKTISLPIDDEIKSLYNPRNMIVF
ncbi:MAG: SH3 domain-containing protein [Odoribacter sp.]|nr:SH3 domain-containing protein [Odoribacter sp.]